MNYGNPAYWFQYGSVDIVAQSGGLGEPFI